MYDILQKLYCTPTIVKLMKLLTFYSLQASIHTHTHTQPPQLILKMKCNVKKQAKYIDTSIVSSAHLPTA